MAPKKPKAPEPKKSQPAPKRSGRVRVPKGAELAEKMFEAHLGQLSSLVETRGARGLKRLYKEARGDLVERLSAVGPSSRKATAVELRAMLGQVDGGLEILGTNLKRHLQDVGSTAVELGGRHAVAEYKALEKNFRGTAPTLDLDRAAVFGGMVDGVERSLLRRNQAVSQSWSMTAVAAMEKKLAIGAMTGKTLGELTQDVIGAGGILDDEQWKAERIVRTEVAYAHGAAKYSAMSKTNEELDEPLWKMLIATFDDRIGDDSILVHGQLVPMDRPFAYKHKRAGSWVVTEYMFPPNRPNDREVMIPWDPSWTPSEDEKPLTRGELASAAPTQWRKKVGVVIPPGHRPGRPAK